MAVRPTVWATRASSPARGIHSDHFHSIEGIPTLTQTVAYTVQLSGTVHKQSIITDSGCVPTVLSASGFLQSEGDFSFKRIIYNPLRKRGLSDFLSVMI